MELLGPFKSVQVLRLQCISISGDSAIGIARALEDSTKEMAQEVLSVLRIIRIHGFQDRAESIHGIEAFVAAHELTGQTLTVCESKCAYDWEESEDEDTSDYRFRKPIDGRLFAIAFHRTLGWKLVRYCFERLKKMDRKSGVPSEVRPIITKPSSLGSVPTEKFHPRQPSFLPPSSESCLNHRSPINGVVD